MKLVRKTKDGWYKCFAWFPVRMPILIENPADPEDKAWQWVWWEKLERHEWTITLENMKQYGSARYWLYRFPTE